MTLAFPVLQVNRKAPCSHHITRDCSTRGPWPHLHRTVQMSDDREDPLQMQLQSKKERKKETIIRVSLNHDNSLTEGTDGILTIKFPHVKSIK